MPRQQDEVPRLDDGAHGKHRQREHPLEDRLPEKIDGVLISHVKPVSPAADEGLRKGDIITEVNGTGVSSVEQFLDAVKGVKKGGYLRLYVYRPRMERSFFAILKLDG